MSTVHKIYNSWDCVLVPTPARLGVQRQHRSGGLDPVPQQFLLEADDGGQHRLVLDFGGRDDNAAVHEVCHGVRQLARILCLEHCLIEHLGRTEISELLLFPFHSALRRLISRTHFICH